MKLLHAHAQDVKWDFTAIVGALSICIVAALAVVISMTIGNSGDNKQSNNGTESVALPENFLASVEEIIEPILRADVAPFGSTAGDQDVAALTTVLGELAFSGDYEQDSNGIILIPYDDVALRSQSIFGNKPTCGPINGIADYDASSCMFICHNTVYHGEYYIEITSTSALNNMIYIGVEVSAPCEVPIGVPTGSDVASNAENAPKEDNNDDGGEVAYELVRTAIVTVRYNAGGYFSVVALRDG